MIEKHLQKKMNTIQMTMNYFSNLKLRYFFCLCMAFTTGAFAQDLPNIVVFIADDAGMDFGCYGNKGIQTPHIDKIASNGMQFEQAFLTSPQCSPSRTSILSGQFAHTIGTEDLHNGLDSATKIVPHYLSEAGYYTGLMLKGHIGKNGMKQFDWHDNGFKDYRVGKWYDKIEGNVSQFLEQAGEAPVFLWVGFIDPHRPYLDSINGAPAVHDPKDVSVPPYLIDEERTRKDLAAYYDEMHRMDTNIGQITKLLEEDGRLDNTLIIFLSDNGYPFPRGKGSLYDSGIKTPLLFSWPGHISKGTHYAGLSSVIDLAPTLLDVAGVAKPEAFYGKSLLPLLKNPKKNSANETYVFAERNWHVWDDYVRSVRSDKYKLIFNAYQDRVLGVTDAHEMPSYEPIAEAKNNGTLSKETSQVFAFPRPMIELYDVENDPYELVNLAYQPEKYRKEIAELYEVLYQWQQQTNDHDPSLRKMLDLADPTTGAYFRSRKMRRYLDKED